MGYFKNNQADWDEWGRFPTFGWDNDMRRSNHVLFPRYTSNKPSKRRAKVKASRKAKLRNQKR